MFRYIFGFVLVALVGLGWLVSAASTQQTLTLEETPPDAVAAAASDDEASPASTAPGEGVQSSASSGGSPGGSTDTTSVDNSAAETSSTLPLPAAEESEPAAASTTTTAPALPVVTTPPASSGSGRGEGSINLLVNAKSGFDKWTKSPSSSQKSAMKSLYDYMVVWSPYFDSRLSWYPNGLAYIDLYAIYTDTNRDQRSVEHPEWILTDASGNRLFIDWACKGGTCPQFAADTGNAAAASWRAVIAASTVASWLTGTLTRSGSQ